MQGQAAVKVGTACGAHAALMMGSIAQQMVKLVLGTPQTRDRNLQIGAKTTMTCELHCKSKSVLHKHVVVQKCWLLRHLQGSATEIMSVAFTWDLVAMLVVLTVTVNNAFEITCMPVCLYT